MTIVRIEDFVRTGVFGAAKLGMSKVQVKDALGVPDSKNDLGETGSIWLYGWYEFYFNHDHVLHSIQNDNYSPKNPETYNFENESIVLESWFMNSTENQCIDEISKLLREKDIAFEKLYFFGRHILKSVSGVFIDFDEEENENGVHELRGLGYWP